MFHFAEPEDAGSGVTIFTFGLIRSSQPVMCSGLPLRTAITTTELEISPLVLSAFQLASTNLGTSLVMSGSSEKVTKSAFWPAATALLSVPLAPNVSENFTPLPASVCWNAGSNASYAGFGTEYPTIATDWPAFGPALVPPEAPLPPEPLLPQAATASTSAAPTAVRGAPLRTRPAPGPKVHLGFISVPPRTRTSRRYP